MGVRAEQRLHRVPQQWSPTSTTPRRTPCCPPATRPQRTGRRDHAVFTLAVQTALRISEPTGLTLADIHLGHGPHVHCVGKGRQEGRTPLLPGSVAEMRAWLGGRAGAPGDPSFATTTGRPPAATRSNVAHLVATRVQSVCPSLAGKRRHRTHTVVMRLLYAGVDTTVIALWLGHKLALRLPPRISGCGG